MLSWRAGEYVHFVLESRIIYTVHAVPESEITHICCPREQDNTFFLDTTGYYIHAVLEKKDKTYIHTCYPGDKDTYTKSWRTDVDPPRYTRTSQYMTNIMLNLSYD